MGLQGGLGEEERWNDFKPKIPYLSSKASRDKVYHIVFEKCQKMSHWIVYTHIHFFCLFRKFPRHLNFRIFVKLRHLRWFSNTVCIPHGEWQKRKNIILLLLHNFEFRNPVWFQANCGWFALFCRGWLKWTRVQWFHYVPLLGTRVRRTWCLTVLPNSPSRAWWKLYIKNCDRNCLITKFISWQFPHSSLTRAWSKAPLFVFPVRTLILFQTRRLWLGFCRLFVDCRNYSSISY